jgi:hypothetical protein
MASLRWRHRPVARGSTVAVFIGGITILMLVAPDAASATGGEPPDGGFDLLYHRDANGRIIYRAVAVLLLVLRASPCFSSGRSSA